jgi:hypothetical protein
LSRRLLMMVFYLFITPPALLLRRVFRVDLLQLAFDPQANTYRDGANLLMAPIYPGNCEIKLTLDRHIAAQIILRKW